MFKTTSKGITPVIATVLLITISVAATVSAFTFINNLQDQAKQNWKNRLDERKAETKSSIDIENAYNRSGDIALQVRNTGSIALNVNNETVKFYVNGRPEKDWTVFSGSSPLRPQQIMRIELNESFPSPSNSKTVEVFAPYSTQDSYVCYNSGSGSC